MSDVAAGLSLMLFANGTASCRRTLPQQQDQQDQQQQGVRWPSAYPPRGYLQSAASSGPPIMGASSGTRCINCEPGTDCAVIQGNTYYSADSATANVTNNGSAVCPTGNNSLEAGSIMVEIPSDEAVLQLCRATLGMPAAARALGSPPLHPSKVMGMGWSVQTSSNDETSAVRPLRTDDEAVVRIHVTPRKLSVAEDGTASHPFSSLHAAVDAVRELKASHNGVLPTPVEVILEPGTHFLTETMLIDTAAAGEQGGHTVTFKPRNASAGSVVSGGVEIPSSSWTKVSDWHLSKNSNVWRAPLPSGIVADGSMLQMWHGQGPITKAPAHSWHRMKLAASPMLQYEHATPNYIKFKPGQVLSNYSNLDKVHLVTYESWTASIHRVASIDASNRTIHMSTTFDSQWANGASGSRFYVENVGEYLSGPGTFWIDHAVGFVYLSGCSAHHIDYCDQPDRSPYPYVLARDQTLVHGKGTAAAPAHSVRFQNITFAHSAVETTTCFSGGCNGQSADFLQTAAIQLEHAHGWEFNSCTIAHTGGNGFEFGIGTKGSTLSGSHVYDLGAGAVRLSHSSGVGQDKLSGLGCKTGSEPDCITGNVIIDNVLNDGGHFYQEGCGVLAQDASDTIIAHNEISSFRYTGISNGWTWGYAQTVVSNISTHFNHIHDIGQGWLSDMGCVYTLGHQPGSTIVNNVCHDVQSYSYGGWAYYTDEGSRDELFTRNIATRTKCSGHHQHYGTDNNLTNNLYYDVNQGDRPSPGRKDIIMKDCDAAIRASTHARPENCHPQNAPNASNDRCCCFPSEPGAPDCDDGKCSSFAFERNAVLQPAGYNGSLLATTFAHGLDNFTFMHNDWYKVGDPMGSTKLFNTGWGDDAGASNFAEWQKKGRDAGSIYADPQLNTTNWALAPSSPARKLGFISIDVSMVGPRPAVVGAAATRVTPSNVRTAIGPDLFAAQQSLTLRH